MLGRHTWRPLVDAPVNAHAIRSHFFVGALINNPVAHLHYYSAQGL